MLAALYLENGYRVSRDPRLQYTLPTASVLEKIGRAMKFSD
jgi:hypothetical protein